MPDQSTPAPTKRQRLAEILTRLGKDATTAMIREEAWKVGYGMVNTWMLISVRNQVWPDRDKQGSGHRADGKPKKKPLIGPRLDAPPCPHCGHEWTCINYRSVQPDGMERIRRHCRSCQKYFSRVEKAVPKRQLRVPTVKRIAMLAAGEKPCTRCEQVLPLECFTRKRDLFNSYCKKCMLQASRDSTRRKLLASFGLTEEQYNLMLKMQDYRCAICCSKDPGGRTKQPDLFLIDHCHKTGKARGLLCDRCNRGLGFFGDNPKRLEAAAHYLRQHKEGC